MIGSRLGPYDHQAGEGGASTTTPPLPRSATFEPGYRRYPSAWSSWNVSRSSSEASGVWIEEVGGTRIDPGIGNRPANGSQVSRCSVVNR